MATEAARLSLSPEQLRWLRGGGRALLRREVSQMLQFPEEWGVEVLRWCLLLPTDILVSILDTRGRGRRYYFDEGDPLAEAYYQKNRDHFSATGLAVEKDPAGVVYGLEEYEVYLRFVYRGDISTVQRRILNLIHRMPQA